MLYKIPRVCVSILHTVRFRVYTIFSSFPLFLPLIKITNYTREPPYTRACLLSRASENGKRALGRYQYIYILYFASDFP